MIILADTLEQALKEAIRQIEQRTYSDGPMEYLEIDELSRVVTIPGTEILFGVESDEKTERKYFRCSRYVADNVDLTQYRLQINYQNANKEKDIYVIDDVEQDGEYITFSWLLSRKVTKYKGDVFFVLCATKMLGDIIENEWNTTLAKGKVIQGLEITDIVVDEDTSNTLYNLLEQTKRVLEESKEINGETKQIKDETEVLKREVEQIKAQETNYHLLSESYAHGETGIRTGEDTDNSKYYSDLGEYYKQISEGYAAKAQELLDNMQKVVASMTAGGLIPDGTITFEELPENPNLGYMYNISNDFITDIRFAEGEGIRYAAGSNVYWSKDGVWDVLAGVQVTGVKGDSENLYRYGNVNITKNNIGLGNVENKTINNQNPTFTQALQRENIAPGETLSILFGKCMKYFADLDSGNIGGSNPTGTIISFMGNNAPTGYLKCDGTIYNISTYKKLSDFFKSEFGSSNYFGGNGTSTFAVPDLRGEFLRGTGVNSHDYSGNGESVGLHQAPTFIPNMFMYYISGSAFNMAGRGLRNNIENFPVFKDYVVNRNDLSYVDVYVGNSSGGAGELGYSTRPTNTSVLYCIRY